MIHAWIFDTDGPFLSADASLSPVPPDTRLAGLTLLRRLALLARHEGADRVTIVASDEASRQRWARSEAQLPFSVDVVSADTAPELESTDQVLLLSAQLLPERGLVRRLIGEALQGGTTALVVTSPGAPQGPALVPAAVLIPLLQGGASPVEAVQRVLRPKQLACLRVEPEAVRHLVSPETVRAAEENLYHGLTSVADGYIDRVFNRRISGWFTRRIIDLPVTPNAVTGIHFTLGMLAVWLFGTDEYRLQLLGALLLQLSVALDCVDGEVARLKYQFSKLGSWLDVWADNLVTIALFLAVAKSAADKLGSSTAITLGVLAATGVLACIAVIYSLARLQSRRGQASRLAATSRLGSVTAPAAEGTTLVDAVINEASSRDFTVLVAFCALIGRLEWIAWLAGIGSHLFWMVFAAIQLAMLRTARTEPR